MCWKGTDHDGKHAFLHLASIFGTEDDHFHPLKVDLDRSGRTHTLCETIGGELASIIDDEIGLSKVFQIFRGGPDEHVVLCKRK